MAKITSDKEYNYVIRSLKSLWNKLGSIGTETNQLFRQEMVDNLNVVDQAQAKFGFYVGLCVETKDIWKQNRIRWFSPIFNHPGQLYDELPWAHCVSPMGGFDDSGLTWVPPAGSTVAIMFENGHITSPYYLGTIWHRDRGVNPPNFGCPMEEYEQLWDGKRDGYLVGPNDSSQVFPPWNTENYNGFDLTSVVDFALNPEAQKLLTYPNIYGFKTPEKHMIKMVDGDPKCGKKWKRFEIMSSRGNWIMMKDDHLHYGGQWAHPDCEGVVKAGNTSCVENVDNSDGSLIDSLRSGGFGSEIDPQALAQVTDLTPEEGKESEKRSCQGQTSNSKIIGGHPDTGAPNTKYLNSQKGANPFFKHSQECRPYKGPQTPLNPTCDLPQTGIQFMSMSGHTFVMDDSVEEPKGDMTWKDDWNFGCNDVYVGRSYWKSATGHQIELSDVEEIKEVRGKTNWIRLLSASGNKIELNDHTLEGCVAGDQRGIHLQSTSNHTIDMVDEGNDQCSVTRVDGGVPVSKAKKAYVRIRSGYGLQMTFSDDYSQEETQNQSIELVAPHRDNLERGPHIVRMQEAQTGPGLLFLRVGGHYYCTTYDEHVTVVGDQETNPSDKIEIVTRTNNVYTKDNYINVADDSHTFIAANRIYLLAGKDADYENNQCVGDKEPRFCSVVVYDYCSGTVRISDRVYASASEFAAPVSMFDLYPFNKAGVPAGP